MVHLMKSIKDLKIYIYKPDDVKQLVEDGYLNKRQISNLGDIPSESLTSRVVK